MILPEGDKTFAGPTVAEGIQFKHASLVFMAEPMKSVVVRRIRSWRLEMGVTGLKAATAGKLPQMAALSAATPFLKMIYATT